MTRAVKRVGIDPAASVTIRDVTIDVDTVAFLAVARRAVTVYDVLRMLRLRPTWQRRYDVQRVLVAAELAGRLTSAWDAASELYVFYPVYASGRVYGKVRS